MSDGRLTVVGIGIQPIRQVTPEAAHFIRDAEKLFYLVVDPVAEDWLKDLNPTAEPLAGACREHKLRRDSYSEMVERILEPVRAGRRVCAAFYGHPGVLVNPGHEAVRQARRDGFDARMLPGVSAEACLLADLGLDPGDTGWQSYVATDFLLFRRRFDPTSSLFLYQFTNIGISVARDLSGGASKPGFELLTEYLLESYPPDHGVVVYEASSFPTSGPTIERLRLDRLVDVQAPPLASLWVPPLPAREPDRAAAERLGMTPESVLALTSKRPPGDDT